MAMLVYLKPARVSGKATQYRIDARIVLVTLLRQHVKDPKIIFM